MIAFQTSFFVVFLFKCTGGRWILGKEDQQNDEQIKMIIRKYVRKIICILRMLLPCRYHISFAFFIRHSIPFHLISALISVVCISSSSIRFLYHWCDFSSPALTQIKAGIRKRKKKKRLSLPVYSKRKFWCDSLMFVSLPPSVLNWLIFNDWVNFHFKLIGILISFILYFIFVFCRYWKTNHLWLLNSVESMFDLTSKNKTNHRWT